MRFAKKGYAHKKLSAEKRFQNLGSIQIRAIFRSCSFPEENSDQFLARYIHDPYEKLSLVPHSEAPAARADVSKV
jgi:hypothetical protein